MTEIWLPVVGWPMYEVSDHGRVRSIRRKIVQSNGYRRSVGGVILKPQAGHPAGYLHVNLNCEGKSSTKRIHVLVLTAFHGPRPAPLTDCCHNNGDPTDNRLSNLRWGTKRSNAEDTLRHGNHHHANLTHCKRGHNLAEHSYINIASGGRQCRICLAASKKRYAARKRAENRKAA